MDSIRQLKDNLTVFSFLIFLSTSICTTASEEVVGVGGAEENWELAKESRGITVYTRRVEGFKHKAVKAEMTVDGSVNALVALVRDTAACSEWADLCKEAVELKQVSANELQVYTYNNIPWPVSDHYQRYLVAGCRVRNR